MDNGFRSRVQISSHRKKVGHVILTVIAALAFCFLPPAAEVSDQWSSAFAGSADGQEVDVGQQPRYKTSGVREPGRRPTKSPLQPLVPDEPIKDNVQQVRPPHTSAQDTIAVIYNAAQGTYPNSQGFSLYDDGGSPPYALLQGALHQGPTAVGGNQVWFWRCDAIPLDFSTQTFSIEGTVKILSSSYSPSQRRAGFQLGARDALRRVFIIWIASDRIFIHNTGGDGTIELPFDTTDSFHKYRFDWDGAVGSLYIDDSPSAALSIPLGPTGFDVIPNMFGFGDGTNYASSESLVKDFSITLTDISLPLACEPSALRDLAATKVDASGVTGDWQALTVSGTVSATIKNSGEVDVSTPFEVTFFEDYTFDGKFDPGSDSILGTATVNGLAAGASETVTADVRGSVLFRDNLIYAFADSSGAIAESDETNNYRSTGVSCELSPHVGVFDPVLRWSRDSFSQSPSYNQVMMTPIVIDLDLDGPPEVLFVTFSGGGYQSTGILRAIHGDTAADYFSVTDSNYLVSASSNLAAADIDGDGYPEIIATHKSDTRLICFEHDGTFKWLSDTTDSIWYAGAAIANLDNIGLPEIVVGRTVFNANGTKRWQGTSPLGNFPFTLVADIDLDGMPEVVAGAAVYSWDGSLKWVAPGGIADYAAVGNLDNDPTAEVVVVWGGTIRAMKHDGSVMWGPESIPGGGRGGPPTIADFDGDRQVEIGVAGNSTYSVFETDGNLRWSRPTQDGSSQSTGSSVFDFDGDGRAEVVYKDERVFRVYDGQTGEILLCVKSPSGTLFEYPVVADVDGDGHADVLLAANDYAFNCSPPPSQCESTFPCCSTGICLYSSATSSWVPTRRIWNQHTYHITNVNDDGTIPLVESNNWLFPSDAPLNNYRQNLLPERSPLASPDLTASFLRFACNSEPKYVTARIGNGGAVNVDAGVPVSFYGGDPAIGGPLLGTTHTSFPMAPGLFEDVRLQLPSEFDCTRETYVVADDKGNEDSHYLTDVRSHFDTSNEAWGVVDIVQPVANPPMVISSQVASWNSIDGNPGGFVSASDPSGNLFAFSAPNSFLGDQSAKYQGLLTFDTLCSAPSVPGVAPLVIMSGESLTLFKVVEVGPPSSWTHYEIRLASPAWLKNAIDGPPATDEEILAVLSTLTALYINGDWLNGFETSGLDNVVFGKEGAFDCPSHQTWDLAQEWSDAQNPNGVWSYDHGGGPITNHVACIEPGEFPTCQPAWAQCPSGHLCVPYWFKTAGANVHDLPVAHVGMHGSKDPEEARAVWTSPINGVIRVRGNVWLARDIGRSMHWTLYHNSVGLTGGDLVSGDPYSSSNPFDIADGSGGPDVLTLPVSVGDKVSLGMSRISSAADFVGIDLIIAEEQALTDSCAGIISECNEGNNIHHARVEAELERLVDVTTSIETQWLNTTYNRATKTLVVEAKATNAGQLALRGPLLMVIDTVFDPGVSVRSPDGYTGDGKPYFVFSDISQTSAVIARGEQLGPHTIMFDDALGPQPRFNYSWRAAVDEAPFFTSVPTTDGVVEQTYQYQAHAIDPDGDVVTYEKVAGPEELLINGENGLVTWIPMVIDVGSHLVILSASDDLGGTATQRFAINVLADIPNRPPVFTSPPVTRAHTGGAYDYQATAIDPDGDPVMFGGVGPDGSSVPPDGLVHWDFALPPERQATVIAEDGRGGRTEQHFTVTVGDVSSNPGAPSIFGTPGVIAAVNQPYIYQSTVSDPDGDPITCQLTQLPAGMTIDAATCRVSWTPTAAQLTVPPSLGTPVTFAASDRPPPQSGNVAIQSWAIKVLDRLPNNPPVILSVPSLIAEVGQIYEYQVVANDPDGQTLHYEVVNPPSGMTIDPQTGFVSWTPLAADPIGVLVAIRVTDTANPPAYGSQVYLLKALPPNVPPVITSTPVLDAVVGGIYRYQVVASDANNDPLRYRLNEAPEGMTVNAVTGLIAWTPTQAQLGAHSVVVAVRDGRAAPVEQAFSVTVTTDTQPPTVEVVLAQATVIVNYPGSDDGDCGAGNPTDSPEGAILINNPATFCVLAADNVGVVSKTLARDGTDVPLDNRGCAIITPTTHSTIVLTATATDASGNVGNAARHQPVGPGVGGNLPAVTLLQPQAEAVVTAPQSIRVRISDDDPSSLDHYCVQVAPAGSNEFKQIGYGLLSGNFEGEVAVFDPTTLPNDAYIVQVRVYDRDGNLGGVEFALNVSGEYKPGRFTTTFTDLTVPVGGIPLTVSRVYDSFDPRPGDFGPGWRLGLPGRVTDTAREQPLEGLGVDSRIYVTRPDGKRSGFRVFAAPYPLFTFIVDVHFLPEPGVTDTLDIPGGARGYFQFGGVLYDGFSGFFNPRTYILTTRQGVKYEIDEVDGLRKITDLNGNTITVTPNGLVSSNGPGITFIRDAKKRITKVIEPDDDPADGVPPRELRYEYDPATDNLVAVYDQLNNITQLVYGQPGFPHYLTEVIDPLGRRGIKNEYDDEGRLTASVDAQGNRIEFDRDIDARQEIITDRLGFPTVLYYDDRGNVILRTDAYGEDTSYQYDANDRLIREEDCAGRVKTYTYNQAGDTLTETNCSGGVTTYTRNDLGQPLTRKDALGNVTTYQYDADGNLLREITPDGGVTTHTYNADGQTLTTTNPLNHTERFEYDSSGRMTARVDFTGARTEYTYNAAGDRLTETRYRTPPGGGPLEPITTRYVYDSAHREIETNDPYGYSTRKEYDAAGQLKKAFDQFGRVTENEYDVLGNHEAVHYADGTMESYAYDPEGRRTSLTNRDAHTTRYEYDRLGRLVKTFQPDGTPGDPSDNPFTEVAYDCVGRIETQWDERRNATQYDYSCAPELQVVTDALGHATEHEFDLVGNRTRMTDALNHTTTYVYDGMGRQIRTIYDDGTLSETRYDAAGRKTRDIDQDLRVTRYEHDAMGRLTAVNLSNAGQDMVTSYTYDELGNQLTQQDAEGRITRFEYDKLSRRTSRTLPLGQMETMTYDAAGRTASKADFNGDTITYEYDEVGRLIRETTPDTGYYEFAYTGTGKRTLERISCPGEPIEDTVKFYDERDRLILVTNPDGSSIDYDYDAAGNRTLLVATTPYISTTTGYEFDALNRLSIVHHPDGGGISTYTYDNVGNRASLTLPNATVATYEYDALNRLTVLTNKRADNSIISRYAYTLSPSGQRTRVDETTPNGNARVVVYTYDDVYRLTGETITDPENADLDIRYVYDKVGNRMTKTLVGSGGTSTIVYSYDDNDRLLTEVETVVVAGAVDRQRAYYASAGVLPPTKGTYLTSRILLGVTGLMLLWPVVLLLPRRRGVGRAARRRRVFVQTVVLALLPVELLNPVDAQRLHFSGIAYAADGDVNNAGTTVTPTTYSYDDNGNTLTRSKNSLTDAYTWDFRNRLIAAANRTDNTSDTTFRYDVDGIRVGKTVQGESATDFLTDKNRDHAQVLTESIDQIGQPLGSVKYVYGDDRLAMTRADDGISFYAYDGYLSTRQLANNSALTTDAYTYDAFGVSTHATGTSDNTYRFAGEQFDPNLGYYYLRARYYAQALGRMLGVDSSIGRVTDPLTLHTYLYARSNPTFYLDPGGTSFIEYAQLFLKNTFIAGFIVGGLAAYDPTNPNLWTIGLGALTGGILAYVLGGISLSAGLVASFMAGTFLECLCRPAFVTTCTLDMVAAIFIFLVFVSGTGALGGIAEAVASFLEAFPVIESLATFVVALSIPSPLPSWLQNWLDSTLTMGTDLVRSWMRVQGIPIPC